jgi:hypothetical protein
MVAMSHLRFMPLVMLFLLLPPGAAAGLRLFYLWKRGDGGFDLHHVRPPCKW